MTIETLPLPSDLRIEYDLRPEQVGRALTSDAELEEVYAQRIEKYRAVVEKKLRNVENSEDNQTIATEALAIRAAASVFGTAGQLNPVYWQRSRELLEDFNDLIDDLLGTSADEAATKELTTVTPRSHTVRTNVIWP